MNNFYVTKIMEKSFRWTTSCVHTYIRNMSDYTSKYTVILTIYKSTVCSKELIINEEIFWLFSFDGLFPLSKFLATLQTAPIVQCLQKMPNTHTHTIDELSDVRMNSGKLFCVCVCRKKLYKTQNREKTIQNEMTE